MHPLTEIDEEKIVDPRFVRNEAKHKATCLKNKLKRKKKKG